MTRLIFALLFVFSICRPSYAQAQTDICETTLPQNWKAVSGSLSLTTKHFKIGKESVKWNWTAGVKSQLVVQEETLKSVAENPRSTFVVWIYNETPINDKLQFKFGTRDKIACSFDFKLNFKGWRTAWVMYHRDMVGKPLTEMNTLFVQAPASVKKGTLFIDQLMYNVTINPRSPMRDEQLPFVNPEADKAANAHWNSLYTFYNTPQYLPVAAKVETADQTAMAQITNRFRSQILPEGSSRGGKLQDLEKEFSFWNIQRNGNTITGRPVFSTNDVELVSLSPNEGVQEANRQSDIKRYSQLMLQVARACNTTSDINDKQKLESIFMDLLDHLEDQGWAYGSGMGALHHLGYNLSGYYSACLLMKDVIKKNNKLDRTFKSMRWFSGLGRSLQPLDKLPSSNIDVFNTLLGSMLSSVLMLDDSPEKLRYLHSFSNWLSKNVASDHTIEGAFKPDGAVFHHGNLYPAYGIGGYSGIAPIIYALSGTSFRIGKDAHESLRNSLMMMHYYTNPVKWPISVSGRHPTGTWRIADLPFAYMAMAGTPDGSSKIDTAMAAVYLKLNEGKKNNWTTAFKNMKIDAAGYTSGHWNLNYGLFDIHRRQDWLLTVRGHNRYFVSHESYPGANMYGRYFGYGYLEVLFPQTKIDDGSYFKDAGWDWNSIPGTTTLQLPLSKLRANIVNADDYSGIEEMLISDERFAGGTALGKQGMFALKLHGHDKYDMGSFRATKSWFMFDSLVVCLGSDIGNKINAYPTQTTLLQNYLKNPSDVIVVNGLGVNSFPYKQDWRDHKSVSIIDNRNIGYYIPDAAGLELTKMKQTSRDQKDIGETTGNLVKLTIAHGNAPVNAGYEYAMLIKTDQKKMETLISAMERNKPLYKVLQKDSIAHSVWYAPQKTTALAVFGSNQKLSDSLVINNSKPCLVMYHVTNGQLSMAVTDPDLAFYEGPDDSPLTENGKRKEVSIYSRAWYRSPSKPSTVKLLIKGRWELKNSSEGLQTDLQADGNTMLTVKCKDGLASKIELLKHK